MPTYRNPQRMNDAARRRRRALGRPGDCEEAAAGIERLRAALQQAMRELERLHPRAAHGGAHEAPATRLAASEDVIYERRRQRLLALLRERFGGNRSALARAIGRKPGYVWRLTSASDSPMHKRLGGNLAAHIESALNLPSGCLIAPIARDILELV